MLDSILSIIMLFHNLIL